MRHIATRSAALALLAASSASAQTADTTTTPPATETAAAPGTDAAVVDSIPVQAVQAQKPETFQRDQEKDNRQLKTVYVTAQKVKQALKDVPASVSSVNGEFIRENSMTSMNDIANYTPNTQIRSTPFGADIRIRGYGSPIENNGVEPSVGTVVDDVYYGRTNFFSAVFYDLDRVEVLRGPQGTLFGKNTTAGVLNVVTHDPDRDFGGNLDVTYGSYNTRIISPSVSIPISDEVSTRVAGNWLKTDGFLYNTTLNRNELNVDSRNGRFKFLWKPSSRAKVMFATFGSHQTLNTDFFQLLYASPKSLQYFRQFDPKTETNPYDHQVSSNVPASSKSRFDGGQLNVEYNFGDFGTVQNLTFDSVSAFDEFEVYSRDIDYDYSPVPVIKLYYPRPSPYQQWSEEMRLSGTTGPMLFNLIKKSQFVFGGFAFTSKYAENTFLQIEDLASAIGYVAAGRGIVLPIGPGSAVSQPVLNRLLLQLFNIVNNTVINVDNENANIQFSEGGTSYAAFGQETAYVTDKLALIGGLRYNLERKHASFNTFSDGIVVPVITGETNFTADLSTTEVQFSPKLGMKYDLSKRSAAYLTWTEGYKGGGFNALAFNPQDLSFEPETARAWEAGVKGRFFGNKLDASFALFSTNFNNLQVSSFNGSTFVTLNAAAARSRGFESNVTWLPPIYGSKLIAAVGYTSAKYTSYPEAPVSSDVQTAPEHAKGPVSCDSSGACTQDLSGQPVAYAPKWTASLSPSFSLPLWFTDKAGINVLTTASYQSSRYLNLDDDPRSVQKSTLMYNAFISVGAVTGSWSLSAGCVNCTKEGVLAQVTEQAAIPGNLGAVTSDQGRLWVGKLLVNF